MPASGHPESFLPAMSAIAREAGALLMEYFHRGLKIEYKGDADLVTFDGRQGWHYPQTPTGLYLGHHPANGAQAVAHLESLRHRGGSVAGGTT